MRVEKFVANKVYSFDIGENYELVEVFIREDKKENDSFYKIIFENDKENEIAYILAILSPIFIACFDNGYEELSFLKDSIKKSRFPYGLNPFFSKIYKQAFDFEKKSIDQSPNDDICLDPNNIVNLTINPMEDIYLKSLLCLIDKLVLDDSNRKKLLEYFDGVDYNILINGRRSILSNGIQAFYLRKYVAVWMIDLIKLVLENNPEYKIILNPIYDLTSNLKTPRIAKKNL